MVIFRNTVGGGEVTNWWDNENNQIAFCVGKRGFAAFNNEGRVLSENLDVRKMFKKNGVQQFYMLYLVL